MHIANIYALNTFIEKYMIFTRMNIQSGHLVSQFLRGNEYYPTDRIVAPVGIKSFVDILTFMSRKNSILGVSEPKKAEFLDNYILMSI